MDRQEFRQASLSRRQKIENRKSKSDAMLQLLDQYIAEHLPSGFLCCYVDRHPEPETARLIQKWCQQGNINLAVPFCDGPQLGLFHLRDWSELGPSQFGLLEPLPELRHFDRIVPCHEVSTFVVPGVAFDREGNRMGYGKGYYDQLLACADPAAVRIGYCYLEQVFEHLPDIQPWDIPMSCLLTESGWLPLVSRT